MNRSLFFEVWFSATTARKTKLQKGGEMFGGVAFTQGGGLPTSSDYVVASGGLALGYYLAAPGGAPEAASLALRSCSPPGPD